MSKAIYNAACGCGIRHPTKAVLKELAWFADDDGKNIWPSVTTLAERTGLSRRAVQKLLRDLEQTGAIDAEGSRLGGRVRGGRGRATRYRINLGWLEENAKTAKKGRPSFFGEEEKIKRANSTARKQRTGVPTTANMVHPNRKNMNMKRNKNSFP
jgi:DNA-binding transcriptional ArsR family regulator